VSKDIGFYLDQLFFPRLGVKSWLELSRIGQTLASFELANINRPVMLMAGTFFEHMYQQLVIKKKKACIEQGQEWANLHLLVEDQEVFC
jgi:hypothetical protein